MINRFRKIYPKLLGSILVPVFLIIPFSSSIQSAQQSVQITFQIKETKDNLSVLGNYGLDPDYLFENIFRVNVSAATFSQMQKDNRLAYVNLDSKMQAAALTVSQVISTSDPYFTLDASKEDRQWYLAKTKVPEAWSYSKGSSSVVVAIVDTGVHATHVELNDGRIGDGYNATTKQTIAAGTNSDDNGHGTAVAGVIGAIPDNKKGIAGINWNVKIMPVKVLAADGTGDTSAVADGIVWAADHGANIINLSLGGPGFGADMTLSNAISYAYNKGVLLVSAAGNDLAEHGLSLDKTPVYPVCGDNGQNMILGVAATDVNDQKAGFSNFGAICIDISAPGKKIVTSAYLPSEPGDNILIYGSGTSLATPVVSGVAALIKASNPNLSNVEIRNLIMRSADNIDAVNQGSCLGSSCNGLIGKGRINALAAISPQPIVNGTLMRDLSTGNVYFLANGTKRLVTNTVFAERKFDINSIIGDTSNVLGSFGTGPALTPAEGTLVKSPNDPQVYVINQEMKRPLTYLVFISRGYKFSNIKIQPQNEIDAYMTGEWYWPPDGTMVLVKGDPTVYVMDKQVRRAVTYFVFTQRRLSFSKVINVTQDEFSHIPLPPDAYWLAPQEGTLIKSDIDPAIYLIENSTRRLLSYEAFVGRGYRFSNIKVLPQVEVDTIGIGLPLLTP